MLCIHSGVRIQGVFSVVPKEVKKIDDDFADDLGTAIRLKQVVGIKEKRVTTDKVTSYDLGLAASRKLMSISGLKASEIDCVLFITQTPDYFQPNNSQLIHRDLGLEKGCACFDVNLGCSGYTYGLWFATCLASTCNNILLIAADTLSKCVDQNDRATSVLFGDAGTATWVKSTRNTRHISWFDVGSDGSGAEALIAREGAFRSFGTPVMVMNGVDIYRFAVSRIPESIFSLMRYSGDTWDTLDYVVLHQANDFICTNIGKKIGLPIDSNKLVLGTTAKYGNVSCASIPITLSDQIAKDLRAKEHRILMSGYGVGLSWASCVVELGPLLCAGVSDLEG